MAVDVSVSRCCWVDGDCEMGTLSLVQVTVVAGPPEEMQVRVLDPKSDSTGAVMLGRPAIMVMVFKNRLELFYSAYLVHFDRFQQTKSHSDHLNQESHSDTVQREVVEKLNY